MQNVSTVCGTCGKPIEGEQQIAAQCEICGTAYCADHKNEVVLHSSLVYLCGKCVDDQRIDTHNFETNDAPTPPPAHATICEVCANPVLPDGSDGGATCESCGNRYCADHAEQVEMSGRSLMFLCPECLEAE